MPANTPAILNGLSIVGLGKETTMNTPVSPTYYVPAQTIKPEDVIGMEDDTSYQNNASMLQGSYQTIKEVAFALDLLAFFETLPNLLVAAGFADVVATGRSVADAVTNGTTTVTSATATFVAGDVGATVTGTNIAAGTTIATRVNGTTITLSQIATGSGSGGSLVIAGGAGSYNHKLTKSDAQPGTSTITDFDGYETLAYAGMMLDQLDLNIDAKAAMKLMTQWKGMSVASASKPTPSWPAVPPGLGWQPTFTIGGVAIPRIESLGVTVKRAVEALRASTGLQTPYGMFADRIAVSAKAKGFRVDDTERNHLINNDQPALVVTWTSPTGSPAPAVTLTASKTAWKKAPPDRTGKYMQGDYDIDFIHNATDGGPCQWLVANGVAAAY